MPLVVMCHPEHEQYGQAAVDALSPFGEIELQTSKSVPRGRVYVFDPVRVFADDEAVDPTSV